MTDIRVPNLGESVTEATISKWFKAEGDRVSADEPLLELETDKVSVEVPAPASGTLSEIAAKSGETVNVGSLLGQIAEGADASPGGARSSAPAKATVGEAKSTAGEAKTASKAGEPKSAGTKAGELVTSGHNPPAKTQAGAGAEAAAREGIASNAPSGNGGKPGNGAADHDAITASSASGAAGTASAETEVRVPSLGESVTEATVSRILKKAGDTVAADEAIVELETDKVSVEVPSSAAGILSSLAVKEGDTVAVGALLATVGGAAGDATSGGSGTPQVPAKAATAKPDAAKPASSAQSGNGMPPAPSARKAMEEAGLSASDVEGTGRRGQIMKGDVLAAIERGATAPAAAPTGQTAAPAPMAAATARAPAPSAGSDGEREERVTMTRLRRTIAKRLKDAQNTAAMLTTFNDVDMSGVMKLRTDYKDVFEKKHGVKLGFMAFFAKACVHALRDVPAVNAEVDGDDLVYKNYYHLGVAVGTDKGLVVPVVRDADQLSFAQIEKTIAGFGKRARDGQLKLDEMQGGTFTITNGGIYGSLMSTPILNAPQSGILGMHRIEQRPVALNGQVVIRPMMYLALSYDHRIVDGKEAVTFLVRVKDSIEDPQRLLLDL